MGSRLEVTKVGGKERRASRYTASVSILVRANIFFRSNFCDIFRTFSALLEDAIAATARRLANARRSCGQRRDGGLHEKAI